MSTIKPSSKENNSAGGQESGGNNNPLDDVNTPPPIIQTGKRYRVKDTKVHVWQRSCRHTMHRIKEKKSIRTIEFHVKELQTSNKGVTNDADARSKQKSRKKSKQITKKRKPIKKG